MASRIIGLVLGLMILLAGCGNDGDGTPVPASEFAARPEAGNALAMCKVWVIQAVVPGASLTPEQEQWGTDDPTEAGVWDLGGGQYRVSTYLEWRLEESDPFQHVGFSCVTKTTNGERWRLEDLELPGIRDTSE